MKIEIEKKDLIKLLGKTLNIVEKKTTMPILVNVLLEAKDDELKVLATDLEVSLTDSCPAKVLEPGKIAISAKNLHELVKELSDALLKVEKKENNWLEIEQGKFLSRVIGVSSDEYPTFPGYSGQDFIKVEGHILREMIDKTIYCVSNDETRYYLNGIYFQQQDEEYVMVATDAHRMSLIRKSIGSGGSSSTINGVIIPRKGLFEIKKILESNDVDCFEIAVNGAQLIVRHEKTVLMIRLIEGKYPNYHQFIPQKIFQKIKINREALLQSLKRVSILSNNKSKAVLFSFSNGKMEIASSSPGLGDAKEELEISYSGKEIKIGFNAKYIQDILQVIQDEDVDFELADQLSAGLMRPHDDHNYTCVVMPMRI